MDGPPTALFLLRDKANLQPGQRVLGIGASGGIGTPTTGLVNYWHAAWAAVTGGPRVGQEHLLDSLLPTEAWQLRLGRL